MTILVLDDDPIMCRFVERELSARYHVRTCRTFDEAASAINSETIDAAIIDLNLDDPRHNGVEFLQLFKRQFPNRPAIVESSQKDVSTVVDCMKLGADDYLDKPIDAETLRLRIEKVISNYKKNRVFERAFQKTWQHHQIVGSSDAMANVKRAVENAQALRILFLGETGVGKTPFAWYSNYILSGHGQQPRPFEHLNCACLQKERFQDELFGHKKGAYTGAIFEKQGLVDLAKGGDLFLDEIGDMPLETQSLLLTFLDTMEYYRLGDDKKRKAEVRIMCATNRDLKKLIADGLFRKDLYSRLSQVTIAIPPLRERPSDIQPLLEHFIRKFSGYDKPYDEATLETLLKFSWEEGNVRELKDAVEYLCIMSRDSERITAEHLHERYRPEDASIACDAAPLSGILDQRSVYSYGLERYLGQIEKRLLTEITHTNRGSLEVLAEKLRISRPTLYRRLKKYDLLSGERP